MDHSLPGTELDVNSRLLRPEVKLFAIVEQLIVHCRIDEQGRQPLQIAEQRGDQGIGGVVASGVMAAEHGPGVQWGGGDLVFGPVGFPGAGKVCPWGN